MSTRDELETLPVDSLIVASGTYAFGKGEFHDCWAIPVPSDVSGTSGPDRAWWVLVHGEDWLSSLTVTSRITSARILWTSNEVDPAVETQTEWGVRRPPKYGSTVAWVGGRRPAESLAEAWGEGNVVVSRTVAVGPWAEAGQ
jgi:hypothetical protein